MGTLVACVTKIKLHIDICLFVINCTSTQILSYRAKYYYFSENKKKCLIVLIQLDGIHYEIEQDDDILVEKSNSETTFIARVCDFGMSYSTSLKDNLIEAL